MAEKFIARQPIFDVGLQVCAYELLFRSGPENFFTPSPIAAQSVIVDSTMVFDFERLLGPARAFINVDEETLLSEAPHLLDPKRVVLEVLENVVPNEEVVEACRALHKRGYDLALDDFIGGEKWEPLMPLVKFLKVDYRECGEGVQRAIAERYLPRHISLLAEKVETEVELSRSRRLGYTFFQGYFFCKPTMMTDRDIPAGKTVCMRLLREIAQPEINVETIEDLLEREPSLTYKLLRYINSPLLGINGEVRQISQAVRLLGEIEFRRWVSLVAVVSLATGKPIELARTAVLRGFFCERIARAIGLEGAASELFLMGLLSLADAMLDRSMERILAELPLSDDLEDALSGRESRFQGVYELMLAYERGTWNSVSKAARRIGMQEAHLPDCYAKATEKANELL